MNRSDQPTAQRSKRRRGRKALWLGLFVVLAVVGGRWIWRQGQFTRLRVPLIQAVAAQNTARVRELLEQNADPNVRIDYQSEPLTWASLLRMLRGSRQPVTSSAETVLIDAARRGNPAIVRLLLEYGADVNAQDKTGTTVLMYATTSSSKEVAEELLRHGADINRRGHDRSHRASTHRHRRAFPTGRIETSN